MAGESYGALLPPTGSTFTAGQAARATQIERVRQNLTILGKPRYWHLGRASTIGHINTSYAWAEDAPVVELCEEDVRGLTCTLRGLGQGGGCRRHGARAALQYGRRRRGRRDRGRDRGHDVDALHGAVTPPTGTTRKACRLEIVAGSASYPAYYRGAQLEVKL